MLDEARPCRFMWGTGGAIKYIQDGIEYGPNKLPIAGQKQGQKQDKAAARPWRRGGVKQEPEIVSDPAIDIHIPDEADE